MWIEYGIFLLETATVVVAILLVCFGFILLRGLARAQKQQNGVLTIDAMHVSYQKRYFKLICETSEKKTRKRLIKEYKKHHKKLEKEAKRRLFVIDFKGDIQANAASSLREEITAILQIASPKDHVLMRLESGGGVVHGYGLATSQLERLKSCGISITVSVDKVAASGGYMMAAIADTIIAAPFAIVGSIGVLAQIPNFNRWLKNKGIDFEQVSAGEYKRTLTVFGKNTETGRKKLSNELEETHALFKDLIKQYRPEIDLSVVATGEHWFGKQALKLKLIDKLQTSDDFILNLIKGGEYKVYRIEYKVKQNISSKMKILASNALSSLVIKQ